MSETILQACKELIDDAKLGCADLVFKEICLEILYRAKHVLNENHFRTSSLRFRKDERKKLHSDKREG